MKKLFIILVLCICSSLFAAEFKVKDSLYYSMEPSKTIGDFYAVKITAVLPYENGYILKLSNSKDTFEYYIVKGFVFYELYYDFDEEVYEYRNVVKKHTIVKISPNKFETEAVELYNAVY